MHNHLQKPRSPAARSRDRTFYSLFMAMIGDARLHNVHRTPKELQLDWVVVLLGVWELCRTFSFVTGLGYHLALSRRGQKAAAERGCNRMPKQRRSPVPSRRPPATAASPLGVPWWLVLAVVVLVTAGAAWLWGPRRSPTTAARERLESTARPSAVLEAQAAVFARYAGSATCRACHASQHAAWAASHHGLAGAGGTRESA